MDEARSHWFHVDQLAFSAGDTGYGNIAEIDGEPVSIASGILQTGEIQKSDIGNCDPPLPSMSAPVQNTFPGTGSLHVILGAHAGEMPGMTDPIEINEVRPRNSKVAPSNPVSRTKPGERRVEKRGCDDLVYAAAGGCTAAFAALIDANYEHIHAMAWRWVGNGADAEDIAQDVCIKLGKSIRDFRGEAAFTTWLYRITYNTAIDHLRARQKTLAADPSQIVELMDGPGEATPETDLMCSQLWDQVRALPPQQRDSVLLVYAQDLSHGEAANILGCSEKTISWHLHEARKKLKATLEAAE